MEKGHLNTAHMEQWALRVNKFPKNISSFFTVFLAQHLLPTPGAPLTYFNDGGGPTEVHILYPKKSQLQNLSTQKNPYFF